MAENLFSNKREREREIGRKETVSLSWIFNLWGKRWRYRHMELNGNAHHPIHAKLWIEANKVLSSTYWANPRYYVFRLLYVSSAITSHTDIEQADQFSQRSMSLDRGWLFFTIPCGNTDIDFVLPPTNKIWVVPRKCEIQNWNR